MNSPPYMISRNSGKLDMPYILEIRIAGYGYKAATACNRTITGLLPV